MRVWFHWNASRIGGPMPARGVPTRHLQTTQDMTHSRFLNWILLLGTFSWVLTGAESAGSVRERTEGEALAAEIRSLKPASNLTNQAILEIRNAEGRRQRIPVTIETHAPESEGGVWWTRYQTSSKTSPPAETLEIRYRPDGTPIYAVQTGSAKELRILSTAEASSPFAGSDFWVLDLGLGFLHWPEQRIIPAPRDHPHMVKGRSCKLLESRHPSGTPYSRVVSWIDNEFKGLIQADAYGPDGKLQKQFSVGSFKKVDGVWMLKDMEMIDDQRETKTRLEFELKVPR